MALEISEEDPIDLTGTLDTSSNLQLLHDSDSLADYDQTLHAEHSDLELPSGVVRVRIYDFSGGGSSWTMSVEHAGAGGPITWSRGSDHAYYDFGPMSEELDVDVTATPGSSPPAAKARRIHIKITPPDAQGI